MIKTNENSFRFIKVKPVMIHENYMCETKYIFDYLCLLFPIHPTVRVVIFYIFINVLVTANSVLYDTKEKSSQTSNIFGKSKKISESYHMRKCHLLILAQVGINLKPLEISYSQKKKRICKY